MLQFIGEKRVKKEERKKKVYFVLKEVAIFVQVASLNKAKRGYIYISQPPPHRHI